MPINNFDLWAAANCKGCVTRMKYSGDTNGCAVFAAVQDGHGATFTHASADGSRCDMRLSPEDAFKAIRKGAK